MGHSYGGLIVRHYAAMYSDEVSGLVLVDPVDLEIGSRFRKARLDGCDGECPFRGEGPAGSVWLVRLALAILASGRTRLPRLIARMSAGRGASVTERLTGEIRNCRPKRGR